MPENDEGRKPSQSLPEVQGDGNCDSMRGMSGERMEPGHASDVREVRGEGLSGSQPNSVTQDGDVLWTNLGAATGGTTGAAMPKFEASNPLRFYLAAVCIGFGCGISWTLFLTGPFMARHISETNAARILYGLVALTLTLQCIYLVIEGRRLKREQVRLKKYYDAQSEEFKTWCRNNGVDLK